MSTQEAVAVDTPWMTVEECAGYMKFRTVKSFRNFLCSVEGRKLPHGRRGGALMFDRRVVDAFLAGLLPGTSKSRRHGRSVGQSETRSEVLKSGLKASR